MRTTQKKPLNRLAHSLTHALINHSENEKKSSSMTGMFSFATTYALTAKHHHARTTRTTRTGRSGTRTKKSKSSLIATNLFGNKNDGEKATVESLRYELEKRDEWRAELVEENQKLKKERDEAVEALELYKRRVKEYEKDVFRLEKMTLEQTQKFNAFEIVAKGQIKLVEDMLAAEKKNKSS